MTFPATVTIPWNRTSAAFNVTTTTTTVPKLYTLVATAGAVTKSASITVTATTIYSFTSLTCTPAKLIPGQATSCVALLSAQAPAGGLVAYLTSTSANLPLPASLNIAAKATGITFQSTASETATAVETVTFKATVNSNIRTSTLILDPSPKFNLDCNNQELNVLTDGAVVTPTVIPAGWVGSLSVRGTGSVGFDGVTGGCNFHNNGGQNSDTAFVNFTGSNFAQVFDNASEISFRLKSAYSFAERNALPDSNMRAIFDVYDNSGPWYNFSTYTSAAGALQFSFGARAYSAVYTVPAGQEDVIFGKDVVAKIRLKWTSSSFSLYVNDVLVQTNSVSPTAPNWSSLSALTIGSRSTRTGGGGYYASDDSISEFVIR